jgi:hypothetical protein
MATVANTQDGPVLKALSIAKKKNQTFGLSG